MSSLQPAFELNSQFQQALHQMEKTNNNLFITGKAGTGKSTLLSYFCQNTKKEPVLLAPTGVAALNVKGQTIHRFFGFPVDVTPQKIRDKKIKPRSTKIYKKIKTIIIDEISMVRADLMDAMDVFLRLYGPDSQQLFGGVQMIFVGDLYQLPPVVTGHEREIFEGYYQTPYFFSAHALANAPLMMIELEKIYRQKDEIFVELLNRIRNNSVEPSDIEMLNQRFQPNPEAAANPFAIYLTTTNQRADEINDSRLRALKGKLIHATASIKGNFSKEYYPTATDLQFKIGAQIMLLNNDSQKRWVNGSIGVIEALEKTEEDEPYLKVRLQEDNTLVEVMAYSWEVFRFSLEGNHIISEAVGTFTQFPFRLAWAITIHKSQGKTFDHVVIDIGRGTFVSGQIYVALSRCTSFEGITLKTRIQKQHIRTDFRIYSFLTSYHYHQSALEIPTEEKIQLIEQAIAKKQRLQISYLKANDTKTDREIIPLTVGKERYQGKYYLGMRAYCTKRHEERMFRVDRILKMVLVG